MRVERTGNGSIQSRVVFYFFLSDLLFYFKPTAVLVVKWVAQQSARKGRFQITRRSRTVRIWRNSTSPAKRVKNFPGSVGLFDERGLVLSLGAFLRSWLSQCAWLLVCRPAV